MKLLVVLGWISLMDGALAAVIRGDVGVLAAASLAEEYDAAVGWLEVTEGAASFRGTGVLIGEQWVLTAAHNWDAGAVTGMAFNIGGEAFAAESWVQHPGWDGSLSPGQGWDVGLVRLGRPVVGSSLASLYGGQGELGAAVTILGAGLVGSPETGLDFNGSARLYAVSNVIDRVIPTANVFGEGGLLSFDFDDGMAGRNSLGAGGVYDANGNPVALAVGGEGTGSGILQSSHEGTAAAGDSGGPAFADFGNGPELIGLVSWGVNPAEPLNPYGSGYGDVGYMTRISAVDNWVYQVIPEPGSVILCFLGAIALSFRRTRSGV